MQPAEIVKVTIQDTNTLQKISRQTFFDTYAARNTEDNMSKYMDGPFSVEKLTGELNDPNSEFYFAMLDGEAIGYIKLNVGQAQTDLKDENGLEIERIYVLTEYHGKMVAQLLCQKAIQRGREMNADHVWLGVWEENPRAIRFYSKMGFVPFGKHIFVLGDDEQTDIMMKLPV